MGRETDVRFDKSSIHLSYFRASPRLVQSNPDHLEQLQPAGVVKLTMDNTQKNSPEAPVTPAKSRKFEAKITPVRPAQERVTALRDRNSPRLSVVTATSTPKGAERGCLFYCQGDHEHFSSHFAFARLGGLGDQREQYDGGRQHDRGRNATRIPGFRVIKYASQCSDFRYNGYRGETALCSCTKVHSKVRFICFSNHENDFEELKHARSFATTQPHREWRSEKPRQCWELVILIVGRQ